MDLEMILDDPMSFGKSEVKLKRFKTKYSEELKSGDLPPEFGKKKIELKDTEYMKLFLQNNPIHDHDREKASSIAQNIEFNKNLANTNPFFCKSGYKELSTKLSDKEMYSIGQMPETLIKHLPIRNRQGVLVFNYKKAQDLLDKRKINKNENCKSIGYVNIAFDDSENNSNEDNNRNSKRSILNSDLKSKKN